MERVRLLGEIWEELQSLLKWKFNNDADDDQWFEDLKDLCACISKYPYSFQRQLCENASGVIMEHILLVKATIQSTSDDHLLEVYYKHWKQFRHSIMCLELFFRPLKRALECNSRHQLPPVLETAVGNWNSFIIQPIRRLLIDQVLTELFAKDFRKYDMKRNIILHVIHSFKGTDKAVYDMFKRSYLDIIKDSFGSIVMHKPTTPLMYVTSLLELLNYQFSGRQERLPFTLQEDLRETLYEDFILENLELFLEGCYCLLQDEHFHPFFDAYRYLEDVKRFAKINHKNMAAVPKSLKMLLGNFQKLVTESGKRYMRQMSNENKPEVFVRSFISFHEKFNKLMHEFRKKDNEFPDLLHNSFRTVIGSVNKSNTILARYCHNLVKKKKCIPDQNLHALSSLLAFLPDPDTFFHQYRKFLVMRIIDGICIADEKWMAGILKERFRKPSILSLEVSKIYDMVHQASDNRKFNQEFKQLKWDMDLHKMDFSVEVLIASSWPFSQVMPQFILPPELEQPIQMYTLFFLQNVENKKLQWMDTYSSFEVQINFTQRPEIVEITGTCQLSLLLMFNTQEENSFKEFRDQTKLPEDELKKHLKCLCGTNLIKVDPNDSTVHKLNRAFVKNRKAGKVNRALVEPKEQDTKEDTKEIKEASKYHVQACIIRIMKAAKVLQHDILIEEVIKTSKHFLPKLDMIETCIKTLLEKEYLAHTSGSTDEYKYIPYSS